MVSEFRQRKMMHVFNTFFDANQSGFVEERDFLEAFEKIAEIRGWVPGDGVYEAAKNDLLGLWAGLQEITDNDNDGIVTAGEWIKMWDEFSKDPSNPGPWHKEYCEFMFQTLDEDADGEITSEEFSTLFAHYGLREEDSVAVFKKMAGDGTGIKWDYFKELWTEYFVTEDQEALGNYIYGCFMCSN